MMNYEASPFQDYESITVDELKDQARQAQNGMQIAEIHQFPAHAGTVTGSKQHIIRQYHGAASLAVRLQAAIDHLQKVQLLV